MMMTAALVGRVGGLAVALGIGAAIGTAVAAPAWASPDDSSASASSGRGHTHAASAAARPTGSPSSAASVRVAPAAGVLKTPPVQPKSPVSPIPQALTAAVAAGRDVEQKNIVKTLAKQPIRLPLFFTESAPWPATNVPEGTGIKAMPARPVTNPVGFKDQVTIFKNIPFSFPRKPAFFITHVSGDAMFTDNTVYDLHTSDQYDWNKLTGISFNILQPDQNALMVAWRYNVIAKNFEIAPYYNVDLARILPKEPQEVISVPIGEKFSFYVDYNGITLRYGSKTVFKPIPADLHPNQLTAFRVQTWFGGTSLPPNTLTLYLNVKS